MSIKFSVLMSVYIGDQVDYIRQAVDSILHQTMPPSEVVIILDGPVIEDVSDFLEGVSKDNSIIKILPLVCNRGLAYALNYGLRACSNEIVARMDADDISLPFRFEKTIPVLAKDEELSLVGGQHMVFCADMSRSEGIRNVPLSFAEVKSYSRLRTPINHPTIAFRKTHVQSVMGYPEDIGRFEDWGLSLALLKGGFVIVNVKDVVLHVRGGAEMMSRRSGVSYMLEELKALILLRKKGLLSTCDLFLNVALRAPFRILPVRWLKPIYSRFLRGGEV